MNRERITRFTVRAPFGDVRGAATPGGLALVVLPGSDWEAQSAPLFEGADVVEGRTDGARQIEEYLSGARREFTCELDLRLVRGAFSRDVLRALFAVPFGALTTYGALAGAAGRPKAARAVGGAVGRNPLPIIVPCHRVIASDGRLGGFSAGLPNKRALLALEGLAVDGAEDDETSWSQARVRATSA
jgi:methylated-DNA-[protein]-cysteine S-methyltransferase